VAVKHIAKVISVALVAVTLFGCANNIADAKS
jgi:hypothetical protein